jgi:2,3-bisphosphoglycerate-dependent phosphoglycerate mutase
MPDRWPNRVWIVRHGESAGNVARDAAMLAGAPSIQIAERDVDVPLSALGAQQAQSLGRWFADVKASERPEIVLTSPYQRAVRTAAIVAAQGGVADNFETAVIDERLREKEFGVLDRLTREGIEKLYPEQAEFRRRLGKFYHRPPAGESWCDVILRLRGALETICLHYAGRRVLIVAHQVVVLCLRYLLEDMTEQQILAIDAEGDVANCAVTEYAFDPNQGADGKLVLLRYNYVAPMRREGTPVTDEPDANVAAR